MSEWWFLLLLDVKGWLFRFECFYWIICMLIWCIIMSGIIKYNVFGGWSRFLSLFVRIIMCLAHFLISLNIILEEDVIEATLFVDLFLLSFLLFILLILLFILCVLLLLLWKVAFRTDGVWQFLSCINDDDTNLEWDCCFSLYTSRLFSVDRLLFTLLLWCKWLFGCRFIRGYIVM